MKGIRNLLVPMVLLLPLGSIAQNPALKTPNPNLQVLGTKPELEVGAKSAVVMDATTGKVLWSKDMDTPRFPASTTKIMTGLLLLEHTRPTDIITAPADIAKVKESSMHLKPGEKITAHDMLYALMLRSANDGCYAVACHISGNAVAFAQLMNERAKEIGCTGTHFNNPNGLNDPEHTTTAHDLALIAREAMKLEPFRQVVHTYKYEIARSINKADRIMVNHNKMLPKDPTADGIKTGYTNPAGHCYVGSATRNGYRVITVVMNSDHWQQDHQAMLHWAFDTHSRLPLTTAKVATGVAPVVGGVKTEVAVAPTLSLDTLVSKKVLADPSARPFLQPVFNEVHAPVKKGQLVGNLVIRDQDGFSQQVPLEAEEDIEVAPKLAHLPAVGGSGGIFAVGGILAVGTMYVRARGRAKRRWFRARQAIRPRF